MPRDNTSPAVGSHTEFTVPESMATLMVQQRLLRDGHRDVQMFPTGTNELALPDGMERVETPRGTFHFNPDRITAKQIVEASITGRENEILGMGPYSKLDVIQSGEPQVCVVERAQDMTEVVCALTIAPWAGAVMAEMMGRAAPGHFVTVDTPALVIRDRLADRRN